MAVIALFCLLGVRLVYVQAYLKNDLGKRADRQVPEQDVQKIVRNKILDRNGAVLAETVRVVSCFVDPTQVKDKTQAGEMLARELNLNASSLVKNIKSTRSSFMWVKRNLSAEEWASLRAKKIKGVGFRREWRRNYPQTPIAPHVLGLVGIDGRGLSGVEMKFEECLSGRASSERSGTQDSSPAGHVQLTLDAAVQKIAERELEWGAQKTNAKSGMVVIQNPMNGDILAMATWPPVSLDPDNPSKPDEMRIPPLVDVFEPGSTYKVVTAAAAIEEGVVTDKELFSGENGRWKVRGIAIHDHEPRPWMTFDDIFIYSSNIGTAKVAERLGNDRLFQYSRLFGFGVYPGSGLPAEAKGVLRSPRRWSGVSKYTVSFGQEVGVTAVQLVGAYSAIANGGLLMEPRVIKSIRNDRKRILWESRPASVRRVVSEATMRRLTDILGKVVAEGTGQNAALQWRKDLRVAGKTGTAQKFDNEAGKYSKHVNLVSFCGFFPIGSPRYTMIVILDEPEGRRWGGLDAAPIFRRIAEQLSQFTSA